MAATIKLVDYFYLQVANKPGEGANVLGALRKAKVNLLVFSGFPEGRQGQLDVVPEDPKAFVKVAEANEWGVVGPKKAFWIHDDDKVGAVSDILETLGEAGVNVTAASAMCAGGGRYGMVLWVNAADVKKAAKALGVA